MPSPRFSFRVDMSRFTRKIVAMRSNLKAEQFKPELLGFVSKTLSECVATTPVRDLATIQKAQRNQYAHRVDYIPNFHAISDPYLIVKRGQHFFLCGGKWYQPQKWKVPDAVWSAYQSLLSERNRRLQTAKEQFIKDRAQARFLYAKSWTQIADDLGISIGARRGVRSAVSRRKPQVEPVKAKGRLIGSRHVINAILSNPFLEVDSRYKNINGADIIYPAMESNRPAFNAAIQVKLDKMLKRVFA